MKHKLFKVLLPIILLLPFTSFSQVFTGGNMGVSYADGYVVELAPVFGYKYLKILESGASPFFSYSEKYQKYAFGTRIFTQITVYKETFVHLEFEAANTEVIKNNIKTRQWLLAMPVGGGYRYEITKGVFAYGMILYNVFQQENSHTKNPILRGGLTYQL